MVVGETTGFAHTADLSERGLLAAAQAAASVAREGGRGVREVALGPLNNHPSGATMLPKDVDKARKIELMNLADDAARSEGSSITQVSVALGDSSRRFVVANSEGVYAADHQVRTRFNVTCIATGDTGMQTGYRPIAGTRGFELLSGRRRGRCGTRCGSPSNHQTRCATRTIGRPTRGPRRWLWWHLVPRGLRARSRGRRHFEVSVGVRGQGWSTGRESTGHAGR